MTISNSQYNRIQLFLDADMTLQEMTEFELELADNPAMRSQLDFEQNLRDNLSLHHNHLKKIETKKVQRVIKIKKWLPLAAASIVIAIITLFFLNSKKINTTTPIANKTDTLIPEIKASVAVVKPLPEKKINKINFAELFDNYFELEKIPSNYPIQLADAFSGYEKGNYTSMQKLDIAKITETRGGDDNQALDELAYYYKGISLLKLDKIDDAIKNLQWIKNNAGTGTMKANASWYLALGYLKKGEQSKAKVLLEEISSYGRYKIKVQILLKTLNTYIEN